MAESDWDTVTVLRKKGVPASQAKSKQVSLSTASVWRSFRGNRAARITVKHLIEEGMNVFGSKMIKYLNVSGFTFTRERSQRTNGDHVS